MFYDNERNNVLISNNLTEDPTESLQELFSTGVLEIYCTLYEVPVLPVLLKFLIYLA
jgi:hypothetical protein